MQIPLRGHVVNSNEGVVQLQRRSQREALCFFSECVLVCGKESEQKENFIIPAL